MATILIVDDEQLICDLLRAGLGRQGHEVITASNGREGPELFKKHKPRFPLLAPPPRPVPAPGGLPGPRGERRPPGAGLRGAGGPAADRARHEHARYERGRGLSEAAGGEGWRRGG